MLCVAHMAIFSAYFGGAMFVGVALQMRMRFDRNGLILARC